MNSIKYRPDKIKVLYILEGREYVYCSHSRDICVDSQVFKGENEI